MLAEKEPSATASITPAMRERLAGVHHTARPTWKLAETVHFYRDIMGLEVIHAISARGWGPATHPDFLHFFFDSGQGSTIAFFYYLKTEKPVESVETGSWLYNSVHTAWRVESRAQLDTWRARLEGHGLKVMQVSHEIIDSIYVTDPNGYAIEIAYQGRAMDAFDAADATMTLEAAIQLENERGHRVETVDDVWQRKGMLVDRHVERTR